MTSVNGSIDQVHNGKCLGWALDDTISTPVVVNMFIDGTLAASGKADRFREDLRHAGVGDGNAAFIIDFPKPFRDGCYHAIEAQPGGRTDRAR